MRAPLFALVGALAACSASAPASPVATAPPPAPTADAGGAAVSDPRPLFEQAKAAYTRGDMAGFLAASEAAERMAPFSSRALYNLACACGRNGRPHEAALALRRVGALHVWLDAAGDADLDGVRGDAEVRAALAELEAVKAARSGDGGEVIARVTERDLTTEGIARDGRTGALFVSSAHKRKILRVGPDGAVSDWKRAGEDGLDGVLGIDVDERQRALYACSSADPTVEGYQPGDANRAAVFVYDLDTAALRRRVALDGPGPHACNDLALDLDGSVLVSDSAAPAVLRIPPGAATATRLVGPAELVSPQAIAPTADALFVAEYTRGILRVERATGAVSLVTGLPGTVLGGIDGMRAVRGGFVIIQNGIVPHRILFLESDGHRIQAARVLAMNDPRWHEPTLGIVVGDDLLYVAASQWSALDAAGKIAHPEALVDPVLMKLHLPLPASR